MSTATPRSAQCWLLRPPLPAHRQRQLLQRLRPLLPRHQPLQPDQVAVDVTIEEHVVSRYYNIVSRYQSLDRPVKRRRKVPESILKNTGYNSLPRGAGGPHELEQIDSLRCRVTLAGACHWSRPPVEWQDNSFMYNAGPWKVSLVKWWWIMNSWIIEYFKLCQGWIAAAAAQSVCCRICRH